MDNCLYKFYSFNLSFVFIKNKQIREGITIKAVMMKKIIQFPFNQSTIIPEEDANRVLPAVPIEASKAYCVAVYVLSTKAEINPTKATVANAAARSSIKTVKAKKIVESPIQARIENKILVAAIKIPETNIALTKPIRTANNPPSRVKVIVVSQPIHFE